MLTIPTDRIGADVGRHVVAVSTRMTTAYAAGIGAVDDLYFDDTRPGGVIAPLPFIVSLEWPVLIAPDTLAAIGRDQLTIYDGLVHGFQDSNFFHPIRPGDTLEIVGRIAEIRQTRAGALVACKILTSDARTGARVCESWFGSLFRNATLAGSPASVERPPDLRPEAGLPAGILPAAMARHCIDIPRHLPHVYTECARIWNPIHTERRAALAAGLPDTILHGTCVWAMALQAIAARFRPSEPIPLRRFAARFSAFVVPGQTLELEFACLSDDRIGFAVRTAVGALALGAGIAELSRQPQFAT
jgi:acyl dehydratase